MFEDEWKILTEEIKYEPNTNTEKKIIQYFRNFIIIVGVLEIIYFSYLIYQLLQMLLLT
jgi:hypothetical protein